MPPQFPGDDVDDVLAVRGCPSESKGKAHIDVEPPSKRKQMSGKSGELAVGPGDIGGIKKTTPACLPNDVAKVIG